MKLYVSINLLTQKNNDQLFSITILNGKPLCCGIEWCLIHWYYADQNVYNVYTSTECMMDDVTKCAEGGVDNYIRLRSGLSLD